MPVYRLTLFVFENSRTKKITSSLSVRRERIRNSYNPVHLNRTTFPTRPPCAFVTSRPSIPGIYMILGGCMLRGRGMQLYMIYLFLSWARERVIGKLQTDGSGVRGRGEGAR